MSLSRCSQGRSKFGPSKLSPVSSTFDIFISVSNLHYKANSAKYLTGAWNKVNFTASIIEGLPGHMSIYTPDPKTLLTHVPPFHTNCIQSFTLIPAEECIPVDWTFGRIRTILTWCIVTKCGRYNGDLGYMISFNVQSGLSDLLVASRDLCPHPRCNEDDLIGMDPHAR